MSVKYDCGALTDKGYYRFEGMNYPLLVPIYEETNSSDDYISWNKIYYNNLYPPRLILSSNPFGGDSAKSYHFSCTLQSEFVNQDNVPSTYYLFNELFTTGLTNDFFKTENSLRTQLFVNKGVDEIANLFGGYNVQLNAYIFSSDIISWQEFEAKKLQHYEGLAGYDRKLSTLY